MATAGSVEWQDLSSLLAYFDVPTLSALAEDVIDPEVDSDVELVVEDGEVVLQLWTPNGSRLMGVTLGFPMTEEWFWECVHDIDDEVMGEE